MEIPFCTLVEVRLHGISPDTDVKELVCKLKLAEVVAQCVEECRCDDGCIEKIIEKDVVRLEVKVERLEEILVPASPCPTFPHCT